MAGDRCGNPAQGRLCASCEQIEHLEDRHGVPADHIDEEDSDE